MLPRKDLFELPEGMIYLDGNSLGPLPKSVDGALSAMVTDQWGAHLIKGWNVDDWMGQPMRVGNMVGRLIGAPEGTVTMGDTLSVKVYHRDLCRWYKYHHCPYRRSLRRYPYSLG